MKIKVKFTNSEMFVFSELVIKSLDYLPQALESFENLVLGKNSMTEVLTVCSFLHKNKAKFMFVEKKKVHRFSFYVGDIASIISFARNYNTNISLLQLNSVINKLYRPFISYVPQNSMINVENKP